MRQRAIKRLNLKPNDKIHGLDFINNDGTNFTEKVEDSKTDIFFDRNEASEFADYNRSYVSFATCDTVYKKQSNDNPTRQRISCWAVPK